MREAATNGRPVFVSFSGIDGAGKSTQSESLSTALAQAGIRVERLAFWEQLAVLSRLRQFLSLRLFRGDAGVGTPERPVQRRDKNVQSPYLDLARCLLYSLEALWLRVLLARTRQRVRKVVIFDRYLYDELANLPLRHRIVRSYVGLLAMLVPRPDLAFLLDADPAEARARKPEYPLEFLDQNRASYLALARLVNLTIIPPLPQAEVTRRLVAEISNKLGLSLAEDPRAPSLAL